MHYKDGTPARMGDVTKKVTQESDGYTKTSIGLVVETYPGSDSCNINVSPLVCVMTKGEERLTIQPNPWLSWCWTTSECERVA